MATLQNNSDHPLMSELQSTDKQGIMKAVWNETVLAESDNTIEIEGNHYFPPESVNKEYLKPSDKQTTCPWKGEASYYPKRLPVKLKIMLRFGKVVP